MSTQTYIGGCQCKKVRYQVSLELGEVISCNCSRCQPLGVLWTFVPEDKFKLLSGADATTTFRFNKHVTDHLFCTTCGIQSYARGKRPSDGADVVAVNARCLDGVEPKSLKIKHVNGRAF